MDITFCWI